MRLIPGIFWLLFAVQWAGAELHFDVEPIPGGTSAVGKPTGINDQGYVVTSLGYRWDGTSVVQLPSSSVLVDMSGNYSAGGSLWNGLTRIPLVGASSYFAYGVNEQGVGVGYRFNGSSEDPFVYKNGVVTILPKGTYTNAHAQRINSAETIVGWVSNSPTGGTTYPAMWKNGALTVLSTTIGGMAWGVNDSDQVAWSSDGGGEAISVHLWSNGVDTNIGRMNQTTFNVLGLNDHGDVASGGFLFHNGTRYNLNTLVDGGVTIGEIWGINNSMQIAAMSSIGPVRLTPSVPEPALGGCAMTIAGLAALRRRRKPVHPY